MVNVLRFIYFFGVFFINFYKGVLWDVVIILVDIFSFLEF